MFSLVDTVDPGQYLSKIMALRRQSYFDDPLDERYWTGGLHELLSEPELLARHEEDPSSSYLVGMEKSGEVVAYARYSLSGKGEEWLREPTRLQRIAVAHVLLAHSRIRGRESAWLLPDGSNQNGRVGHILYQAIMDRCLVAGCETLCAEVFVAPAPNLPSLRLHYRLGFRASGLPLRSVVRVRRGADVDVQFLKLNLTIS
jgi:hypothetical protein